MSTFTAKIIAELDVTKIPSAIEKIKQQKVTLQNVQVNKVELSQNATSTLAAQVQNALNSKTFTVNINGVNVSGNIGKAGTDVASKISKSISDRIQIKVDTGTIDAQIARVQSKYENLKSVVKGSPIGIEIEADLQSIDRFKAQLESALQSQDTNKINEAWKNYESTLKGVTNKLSQASIENKKFASSLQIKNLDDKMATWLVKNTKAAKTFGVQVEELRNRLAGMGNEVPTTELQKLSESFKQINLEATKAGQTGRTFREQFSGALTSISKYVSASTLIYQAIRAAKQMAQAVYDIDTAMTNLKKVTDETDSTYQRFLSSAAESAKDLGRSVSSLVEQTATWAKLGYSLSESSDLAKLSSIYANVAEVDDATAVSDLVTAMKAYNIEAQNAITIIDPLNELGNRFATDAAKLGQGLTRSASALATSGTDLYHTLALLTGGAEITQNAEEFGNFLKVSSMRIRGIGLMPPYRESLYATVA